MTADAAPTKPLTWAIDPFHGQAQFSAKHLMIATVTGLLGPISGTLRFDPADLTAGSAEATIDVSALSTGNARRDADLRADHFFDVEHYPTIEFRSTGVQHVADQDYLVRGELTIRGIMRPVRLEVRYEGQTPDPCGAGSYRAGFTAQTTLSRQEYGMTHNPLLEAGGAVVGDKIKVTIHIEAVVTDGKE